ncbi:unnamed protein product, partial [Symbiodinium sp. KB8]
MQACGRGRWALPAPPLLCAQAGSHACRDPSEFRARLPNVHGVDLAAHLRRPVVTQSIASNVFACFAGWSRIPLAEFDPVTFFDMELGPVCSLPLIRSPAGSGTCPSARGRRLVLIRPAAHSSPNTLHACACAGDRNTSLPPLSFLRLESHLLCSGCHADTAFQADQMRPVRPKLGACPSSRLGDQALASDRESARSWPMRAISQRPPMANAVTALLQRVAPPSTTMFGGVVQQAGALSQQREATQPVDQPKEQLVDTSAPTHAAAVKCVDQCMAPSRWLPKTSVVKYDKLLSQAGDAASCAFTALPASTDSRVPHEEYRVIWCFADSGYPFHWRRGVALAMAAWTHVGVLAQLARLNKRPPASAGIEVVSRWTHQPRHTYTFLRLLARARDRQKAPWWWAAGAQQAMMRARAHVPQEIQQALAMARMTALRKPDGGVRGIATGDAFRRLVARTLAKQWADVFDNATRPYQFALQARAGTDALAAHVRVAIAQRRDAVLVSLDGRSAYDCMSRLAFLSKLRDVAPELSSLSSACFMANHRSTAGGTTASASGKSSEQGDALAPSFAASLLSLPLHGTANVDGPLPDLGNVLAGPFAARVCREAGAAVALDVFVRDLNLHPVREGDCRLEVIANGLGSNPVLAARTILPLTHGQCAPCPVSTPFSRATPRAEDAADIELGEWRHGWQSRAHNRCFRDHVLLASLPPASRAMLSSQAGREAGAWLTAIPSDPHTSLAADVMQIALRHSRCCWHQPLVVTAARLAADSAGC